MRGIVYAIAVIAAVGIMIGIATSPNQRVADQRVADQRVADQRAADQRVADTPASTARAVSSADAPSIVMSEAGSLTFSVPSMHCEFACFPRVKEAIESVDGVQGVELAAQKVEGAIDNRQVIVKYDSGFDVGAALSLLAKEGFDDSERVQ